MVGTSVPVAGLQMPDTRGLTVRYSPPEVLERMSKHLDRIYQFTEQDKSIDIYALAVTLYELAARQGFMHGVKNNQEILIRVLNGNRMDFTPLPDLPGLSWAITKGWEQLAKDRPNILDVYLATSNDIIQLEKKGGDINWSLT